MIFCWAKLKSFNIALSTDKSFLGDSWDFYFMFLMSSYLIPRKMNIQVWWLQQCSLFQRKKGVWKLLCLFWTFSLYLRCWLCLDSEKKVNEWWAKLSLLLLCFYSAVIAGPGLKAVCLFFSLLQNDQRWR